MHTEIMALSSKPQMETLSVAAIEAMFAEKPVVSPDVGFMREIVISGETGELVLAEDPEALAQGMLKLLRDDDLRRRLGKNAALVQRQCHVEVMARQFEDLFQELARKPSPKGGGA